MRTAPSLENTPRVVAVAIAFFGGLALLGYALGAFERFDRVELALLTLFAVGFTALSVALDPGVRALIKGLATPPRKVPGSRRAIT